MKIAPLCTKDRFTPAKLNVKTILVNILKNVLNQ